MDIAAFFAAVWRQDAEALRAFFCPDAVVDWPCTNERFTVDAYIRANCEYPGDWAGTIERTERAGDCFVVAARVYAKDGAASFHVVSFLKEAAGKIAALTEYWGDDGPAPAWRQEMHIGRPIR